MKFCGDISREGLLPAFILSLVLLFSSNLCASESSTDVPGSSDSVFLKRYPRSHIIEFEKSSEEVSYNLILGSLKKVNKVLSPKKSRRLNGKLTRMTYRIPDGIQTREVSEHFKSQLDQRGEILFTCEQRECGSSNHWANTVFQEAQLYGPEEYQFLLVGQFVRDNQQHLATIYTIQRGNRRVYAHLEIIEASLAVRMDPASMYGVLQADGLLHLDNLKFDANDQLIDDPQLIGNLVTMLNIDSSLDIYIVGHLAGPEDLDSARVRSIMRAEQLMARLVREGIEPDRLSAEGVGPLAPAKGAAANRIDLVLRNL